ncbi:insertion element iso-IS1N protein insA [Escherichia sp. KTE52]|nr:insertion element iso-IS1N protein insA [Escherichia sp. KTE52]
MFFMVALTFIVPVVSLLRSVVMGRTLNAMTDFDAVTVTACFSSLTLMKACKPGIKELSTEMTVNGAGVRDTTRTLKTGVNTVIRT